MRALVVWVALRAALVGALLSAGAAIDALASADAAQPARTGCDGAAVSGGRP